MTPSNGSKVGIREFYAELQRQSAERVDMERRLLEAFQKGLDGIREDMKAERVNCSGRFGEIEKDVVALKVADRKWGGLTALVAAAFTGIGTAIGIYAKR